MGARPRELRPDRSARDLYGAELRRLRTAQGLSLVALAELVHSSKSHLSDIERAARPIPPGLSEALDAVFETGGSFVRLYLLAKKEAHPDKYRAYMEVEAAALSISGYAATMIPGLLQTEEYASAVIQIADPMISRDRLTDLVGARIDRQDIFRLKPPQYWAVLDESVVRRPVGGSSVFRKQLHHLLNLTEEPWFNLQVLSFSQGEHALIGGSLILLTPDTGREVAYSEGLNWSHLVDDPREVDRLRQSFDTIRACAMSPKETKALIQEQRDSL